VEIIQERLRGIHVRSGRIPFPGIKLKILPDLPIIQARYFITCR
jgi:hypothetical protein